MSLLDILFGHRPKVKIESEETFKMLNGYTPRFTSWRGSIYEAQLVRAAIHARATHVSKLKVEILGSAKSNLRNKLKHAPNQFQTWSQFMYRTSSLLDTFNTAFITPVFDEFGQISGIYTPLPRKCEIIQIKGVPYLRYEFGWGDKAAIELSMCGILTKHQLNSDFFGETNEALKPTMELIHIQNQGIEEGVKTAASYQFMAKLNNFSKIEDIKNERKRFSEENFGAEEKAGGILLFPNTYNDIKQIEKKPWVVDSEQMKLINESVYEYFGVNEDIIENKAYGDKWTAFYEGAIEPFAIQFSEVLTKMLFTLRERSEGNEVMATANRLQYLSNTEKLNVSAQLLDRGIISINDAREIWNLPPVEGGDARIIRGEYYSTDEKITEVEDDGEGEENRSLLHDEESVQRSDSEHQIPDSERKAGHDISAD